MSNARTDKVVDLEQSSQSDLIKQKPVMVEATEVIGDNHDEQLSGRKVRVTFYEGREEHEKDAIFASLNGYAYQIPRNVPVDIPIELMNVFQDAKTQVIETVQGGGTRARNVPRFGFTLHGEVKQAAPVGGGRKKAA